MMELIYQANFQKSDITCGFDFWERSYRFYDVWGARSMSGNMLRDWWFYPTFSKDPRDRARFYVGFPIQVSQISIS